MKGKFVWLIVSCLMVVALVLASCKAPVTEKKEEVKGVVKEAEKKEEKVEEVKEKTKYGGILYSAHGMSQISWDDADVVGSQVYNSYIYDPLLIADWCADRALNDYNSYHDWMTTPELFVGSLAESYEWPEPLTMTFKIRKGVRWQNKPPANGRELTADDVVAVFERLMENPKQIKHMIRQNVESVEATDKYTVVFKMKEPNISMLQFLGPWCYITCPDVWETYGDLREWKNLVGTGPFILEDYVHDSSVTYTRNPDYFAKDCDGSQLPYVDGVKILIIKDAVTRIAALRTRKIDYVESYVPVLWDQKASLETTNPELQWAKTIYGSVWPVMFKTSAEPFDNIKVRQALSMATNRDEIVSLIFGGNAMPFAWPIRPSYSSFTPLEECPETIQEIYTWSPDNVEKAKKILADAGYPNGFKTVIQYNAPGAYEPLNDAMQLLNAQWAKVGVDLELRPVDRATSQTLKAPPFPFEQILGVGGGQQDPITIIDGRYVTGGGWNRVTVSDTYIDESVLKAAAEFDGTERDKILKELNLYILEQCYDIAMPTTLNWTCWYPWVHGFQGEGGLSQHGLGGVASRIWLDTDLRKEITGR